MNRKRSHFWVQACDPAPVEGSHRNLRRNIQIIGIFRRLDAFAKTIGICAVIVFDSLK
jgi:hypothetical protein